MEYSPFATTRSQDVQPWKLRDGETVCGRSITSTGNCVYFAQPLDGTIIEPGSTVEVWFQYRWPGSISGILTYLAVTKDNEAVTVRTIAPTGTVSFVESGRYASVTLTEPGVYVFHVSTVDGVDDPDQATVYCGVLPEEDPLIEEGEVSDTIDGLTWTLEKDGIFTLSGTGSMSSCEEDSPWKKYKNTIRTVIIEKGVTNIGNYAFYDCSNLESLSLPDSLLSIGNMSFCSCSKLNNFTIPQSVNSIGDFAFCACDALTEVTIPGKLRTTDFIRCTR